MTGDLLDQFNLLQNEVGALTFRLRQYAALFNDRNRSDFLFGIAPAFFQMLSETLWADMLMHLSRVTGRASTGRPPAKFDNLTLVRLPDLVDPAFSVAVGAAVKDAVDAAQFAGPARSKVYAHSDLYVAKNPAASGITLGSFNEMRKAIDLAEAALDVVAKLYGQNRGTYFHTVTWGIADDMVKVLELGAKARYDENAAKIVSFLAADSKPAA